MNRPDLYKKTVDILYDAYFNDTLEHGNCYACAVGNIIAANRGFKFSRTKTPVRSLHWDGFKPYDEFWSPDERMQGLVPNWMATICGPSGGIASLGQLEIKHTGYDPTEIKKIENAFESAEIVGSAESRMFEGLCLVLEALKQIHEVTDEELISSNQKRFADHHKILTASKSAQ